MQPRVRERMSLDRGLIAQTFCGILLLGEAAFVHLTGSTTKHFGEEEPDDPSSPLPCYEEARRSTDPALLTATSAFLEFGFSF